MRISLVPALCVLLATSPARAGDVVTLGDSLTFAYEAEFGFRITIPFPLPFSGTYGDGMPAHVRNWIEILGAPGARSAWFDHGGRKTFNLNIPFGGSHTLLLRHEHNWAIPGLRIAELRRFVLGEATFLDLLSESDDFALLGTALALSDFDEEQDFLERDRLPWKGTDKIHGQNPCEKEEGRTKGPAGIIRALGNFINTAVQRATQRTQRFIRWVRVWIYRQAAWGDSIARLRQVWAGKAT